MDKLGSPEHLGNRQALASKSVEKLKRQADARARFGDRIFSGSFDNTEVSARFKARPELMPNTLSDCLLELGYWHQLDWLRHAVYRDGGDSVHEASTRDWFVFYLLTEIRPRNRDEAKAALPRKLLV